MSCEEFADYLGSYFDEMSEEMYWDGGVDTVRMFTALVEEARKAAVQLHDLDTWDYDRYFNNLYRFTEKGLS